MSLKELTKEKHTQAESTAFMKAVFSRSLPLELWIDWTYQKWLFYQAIENSAGACNLLHDLPDIRRTLRLYDDFKIMNSTGKKYNFRPVTLAYYNYVLSISQKPQKVVAHLYTWHMGDMFGGQMIKKIVPGSHQNLEFDNTKLLIENLRSKLDDSMAEEANLAFDWAIRMMNQYEHDLGSNKRPG